MGDPDEADALARDVIKEIRKHLDLLTFRPSEATAGRAYCAAGLARGLALVDAIELLEANGRADVAGVLARVALEVHHVALYSLLGGVEAVAELEADHAYYLDLIVNENAHVWDDDARAELDAKVDEWGQQSVLPFGRLRRELQKLLNVSDDPVDLTPWYTLLYRGESTYNVHGIGPIQRYLDLTTNPWRLIPDPPPIKIRVSYATTTTVIVGHIAWWLFGEHGIGRERLGELTSALRNMLAATR